MMVKKVLTGLIAGILLAVVVTACGVKDASTVAIPTVHMGATGFIQDAITLQKEEVLTLVDETVSPYQIENGRWVIGAAKQAVEPGTPLVNQVFNGYDSAEIGPFTTAGIFHLYCALHQGMNLTVTVKQ